MTYDQTAGIHLIIIGIGFIVAALYIYKKSK